MKNIALILTIFITNSVFSSTSLKCPYSKLLKGDGFITLNLDDDSNLQIKQIFDIDLKINRILSLKKNIKNIEQTISILEKTLSDNPEMSEKNKLIIKEIIEGNLNRVKEKEDDIEDYMTGEHIATATNLVKSQSGTYFEYDTGKNIDLALFTASAGPQAAYHIVQNKLERGEDVGSKAFLDITDGSAQLVLKIKVDSLTIAKTFQCSSNDIFQ